MRLHNRFSAWLVLPSRATRTSPPPPPETIAALPLFPVRWLIALEALGLGLAAGLTRGWSLAPPWLAAGLVLLLLAGWVRTTVGADRSGASGWVLTAVWVFGAGALGGGLLRTGGTPVGLTSLWLAARAVATLGIAHTGRSAALRQGAAIAALIAARSGAEQRAAEQGAALARAERALDDANRLRHEFLATISHELRTPLNAVINFSCLIGKPRYGTLNAEQRQLQEWTLLNARHLTQIINDILDFARIENGHVAVAAESVELANLLRGCIETAGSLLKDKPIALALELPTSSTRVDVDPTRIRQVVLNLLANAVKFTDAGRITVRLTADTANYTVAVQDTGIGIAPADHGRIFEPFLQAQSELARPYDGTGLGLAISRRLVELHGGRLWVESALGAGATFSFSLPRPPLPLAGPLLPPGAPCIVVVDDNAQSQAIFEAYVTGAGYRFCAVQDSRDALETVRNARPIGVFLDVSMPGLNGWEVLSALRRDPSTARVPVAMCSIEDQQPPPAVPHRPDAYLVKPVEEAVLLQQLAQWAASGAPLPAPAGHRT